jgi:hypothetical protein
MMAQMMAQMRDQNQQMMAQLRDQMDNLRTEQANEREAMGLQIKALQDQNATMRNTPVNTPLPATPAPQLSAPAPLAPPSSGTKKKPTLPDPPRFDGTRRKFPAWLLEMQNKLRTDGTVIGSSKDLFAYIFSRLDDTPKALATTFAQNGGPDGAFNPDAFLTYLSSCYGDPNVRQTALRRLEDLRQGERESFATFLPKFEKELAESGGAAWPDDVQINYLQRSLNQGMKSLLRTQRNMPTDYLGHITALQELGANLDRERYQARRSARVSAARSPSPDWIFAKQRKERRASTPPQDTMDWEPTKISRAIQRQNRELAGKRAKRASEEEVQRRRREGLCTRCG